MVADTRLRDEIEQMVWEMSSDELDALEQFLEKHKMATLQRKGGAPAAATPAMTPLQKRLKALKESWNSGKEESKKTGGATTLSDGRHLCKLTDASLLEGNKGPFVKFEFTAVEGDEIGEKGVRNCGLDSEDRIVYLQRDLRRLGVEVDDFDIEQLPDILAELAGQAPGVRVTVKTNEGSDGKMYSNCYIDKLVALDGSEGEAPAEAEAEAEPEAEAETEEAPAETEAEAEAEPEGETLEVGDDVTYLSGKVKLTGVVKSIDYDTSMIGIRDDKTKKVISVHAEKVDKVITEA